MLACWWVDTRPNSMFITTAPTYDQVHGILWEEIRALHGRLKLPGAALATDEWKIGGRQVGIGRKPPDNAKGSDFDPATFQGYHRAGGVLVILDEASGVPEWLWNAVETVTTTDNCRILAIGNPDNPGSHFAKVCTPGHPGWAQHKISVFDSPNFTGERVPAQVSAALVTKAWESDRRDEWGTDDYKYISKVLAEFPSDHPRQVVSVADLLACQFPDVQPASARRRRRDRGAGAARDPRGPAVGAEVRPARGHRPPGAALHPGDRRDRREDRQHRRRRGCRRGAAQPQGARRPPGRGVRRQRGRAGNRSAEVP